MCCNLSIKNQEASLALKRYSLYFDESSKEQHTI
ncbi:unknown protein [Parachlamydia acanthamoebae UV-7]|uniref:Uncharacterized protein n=1 Tax=Parachlamydia acanthamoebae (strain UV7) TaxID=765952 RepID=F8KV71_PARAV|nr:unknown protein [Parachlamydia acanthamoebae UV-7]